MKAYMSAIALLYLLLSCTIVRSQSVIVDPEDLSAEYLGTMDVRIKIATSDTLNYSTVGGAELPIGVLRTSAGHIDYVCDISSLVFTGDSTVINGTSTIQLFDLIGSAAVAQGIQLGYTSCSSSCPGTDTVRVIQESCVHRLGSGTSTVFTACLPKNYCFRSYTYCCPSGTGSPLITKLSLSSGLTCTPDLTGPCQPTCP